MAREDGSGALTYFHADGLGSIVKRTNQSGAAVHEYRYDAWGNVEAGAGEPGHSFTGREWDPEINLHYYRGRYYDSQAGRFVSEDPARFAGGRNFFAYVGNRPVDHADPLGLKAQDRVLAVCPAGLYKGIGRPRAVMCCMGGRYAACVEEGQYPAMSEKMKTCLLGHESYHIDERLKRDPKGSCKECNQPDCTWVPDDQAKGSPERIAEECHASLLDVECFKDSGERYEDGTDAEKEAIAKVELCRSHNPPYLP